MEATWLPYIAAFVSGLLGGVHCIGMCGGIVGTLTLGLPSTQNRNFLTQLPYHLAYNSGRVTSYVIAGALMGGLGVLLASIAPIHMAQQVLLTIAGIFMVLLGLYIGDWWRILAVTEKVGERLWRKLAPWAKRLLPITNPGQAFLAGMVWGWIPCGLVYAMLAAAIAAGTPTGGALIMLAFGLGTLPNLIGMGVLAGAAAHLSRSPLVRRIAGGVILGFGLWTLAGVY